MIMKTYLSKVKSRITTSLFIFILVSSPLLAQSFDFSSNVNGDKTTEISQAKEGNILLVKSENTVLSLRSVVGDASAYKGLSDNVISLENGCMKKITLSLASGALFTLTSIAMQEKQCDNVDIVFTAKSGSVIKGSSTFSFIPKEGKTIDFSTIDHFKNITSVEITTSSPYAACAHYTFFAELDNIVLSNVHQPLSVSSVSPDNGPVTGGTEVTITGTGFQFVQGVKFGSTDAKSYTLNSATSITAVSPAGSAGTVDVTVVTANGTSDINDNDKFTFNKLNQTITFVNPGDQVYGSTVKLFATATSGLPVTFVSQTTDVCNVSGDEVTFSSAGTCTISANQAGNNAFNPASPVQQSFNVNPKALTIQGLSAENKTYDGTTTATLTGTAVLAGVVSPDVVTLSGTPSANFADAGVGIAKPVTVTGFTLQGDASVVDNYTLQQPTGLVADITKAGVVLTWDQPADITYGTALGNVQLNATSTINGTFAYTPAAGTILNVGNSQTLSVTFTPADLLNYQVVSKSVTINVNKAPLNVIADNIQITHGNAVPSLTYQYSGFVNGEGSSVLDAEPVVSIESSPVNVGTYPIVVSGGADNNYVFNYINGTLTIKPAALSIGTPVLTTTKIYDGNNLAVVTPGVLNGLINGDDVNVTASAFYENAHVGTGKTITVSYVLTGADKDNYQIPSNDVVNTGIITAKQLTISDPVVVISKEYDGNTTAAITSLGELSGVVSGDEANLSVSASANYNDASVGNSKTITVAYTLTGGAASNYIAPVNDVVNNASIVLEISLSLENPKAGCEGGALELPYTILNGSANSYRIVFADEALAAGFMNIGFTTLPSGNVISIAVPKGVKDGTYSAFLQLKNDFVTSELYKFTFTIKLTSSYLVKKFNDVVLVDNSSNRFSSYQWYKDGIIINGAREQFYNDIQGLSGTYHAVVTTVSGQTLEICPVTYNVVTIQAKVALKTYPNPVATGNTVNIEIEGLSDAQLKGAVLSVFSNRGEKIMTSTKVEAVNTITSGNVAGVYFVRLATADGNVISQKITITQ
jgi:hypothetical protein